MAKRVIVDNKREKMSKFEKISIGMSGAAVILAVALPIISYFWLDPQFQSFRNRARLQVTPIPRVFGAGEKVDITYLLTDRDYEIQILNVGNLPAKEVSLALQYGDQVQETFDVSINPPLRTEAISKTNTKFVTLKEAIAPSDKIVVKFLPTPDIIWVTNEFGERTILNTRAPFEKVLKTAQSVEIYANGKPIRMQWSDQNQEREARETAEIERQERSEEKERRLQEFEKSRKNLKQEQKERLVNSTKKPGVTP